MSCGSVNTRSILFDAKGRALEERGALCRLVGADLFDSARNVSRSKEHARNGGTLARLYSNQSRLTKRCLVIRLIFYARDTNTLKI